ncbi:Clavaminate synthase-like protein [Laetiporus sulphureus 93-53]|uniref:Clavaminate synthase-like protein n=1 Tax=Laetiporus sulphureus 93-53 TaxID=1314785 RepID=A0A165F243_9APHY|nr:Clavaminate synthase-like protein [Laetiporus sulphureus 93-53]KZT08214.1 Clavaminate synthase-like protein [Laetiporus sulphureus 93-53]
MPSIVLPPVPHYVRPAPTKEPLDYADLIILDFSKVHTPDGRAELALQVRQAMSEQGFFYIINHGYTQAQNDRIFDIADLPFSSTSEEEKERYAANIKGAGSYQGYKKREFWYVDGGVRDQIEHYNINRDVTRKQHPEALRPLLPEIEAFAKFNHFEVLHNILRLFARGMELPEETFVNNHDFNAWGETYVRFMKYYPRSEEDEIKSKNVWLKGHTDFGTVSILWSQPIAALQILCVDGQWRWIKHIDNALVVNAGDAMEFLSGGLYKGTIHRVVQPPEDQRGYARLGVFYFCMPNDDVKLVPYKESPVLQRVGIHRRCDDADAPTMEIWRTSRTSGYGQAELPKGEDGHEEEIVNGIAVKHYN